MQAQHIAHKDVNYRAMTRKILKNITGLATGIGELWQFSCHNRETC